MASDIQPGDMFAFEPDGGLYMVIERNRSLWRCFRVHGRLDCADIYDCVVETEGGSRVCVSVSLMGSIHPDDFPAQRHCRAAHAEETVRQLILADTAWQSGKVPRITLPTGTYTFDNSAVPDERDPTVWAFHDRLRGLHADFLNRLHTVGESSWKQAR
jgi:hypothetical protein